MVAERTQIFGLINEKAIFGLINEKASLMLEHFYHKMLFEICQRGKHNSMKIEVQMIVDPLGIKITNGPIERKSISAP